jgi:hypothetical protein
VVTIGDGSAATRTDMFDVAVAECLFGRRDGPRIAGAHLRTLILFMVLSCAGPHPGWPERESLLDRVPPFDSGCKKHSGCKKPCPFPIHNGELN